MKELDVVELTCDVNDIITKGIMKAGTRCTIVHVYSDPNIPCVMVEYISGPISIVRDVNKSVLKVIPK